MSYQVLARKWRPRLFAEMAGQEHVLRALINALDNDRLHHAFLFTGTRGVGKTTIARILAKSLNCEKGVSSTPCGKCSACIGIDEGRFVDLIEVDAASRTKVEDTRELLDNVQYAPTRGRYKVYLIDEVHMLSAHSFNALLKTLEEPPPHVKFLLATTDPQKLPVTILSRCLQFNLKRLPIELISGHLETILKQENISYELSALTSIARAADGSMRDALSLLDQAISYGGGKLLEAEVRDMLGSIDQGHVYALLNALADNDGAAILDSINSAAEQSPDYVALLAELISKLHRIALAQIVPDAIDNSMGDREEILALSKRLLPEDVQLYYQTSLLGQRDLELAPEPRGGFEMVLLRMHAFRPLLDKQRADKPGTGKAYQQTVTMKAARPENAKSVAIEKNTEWDDIARALQLNGALKALANNCSLMSSDDNTITLMLDGAHAHLRNPNLEKRLEQALQKYYSKELKLVLTEGQPHKETPATRQQREQNERLEAAIESIENDPNVKAIEEAFGARVIPESIQPTG